MKKSILFLVFAVMIVGACTPTLSAIQTPVAQTVAAFTAVPSQTPYPTYTPYPTFTPIPTSTATPTMTPTPSYQVWNQDQVLAAFTKANLGISKTHTLTEADKGISPLASTAQGIYFYVPAICSDCGGRIINFKTEQDLQVMKAYYESLGEYNKLYFSWVFVNKNVLVQLNGEASEDLARKFEKALQEMK